MRYPGRPYSSHFFVAAAVALAACSDDNGGGPGPTPQPGDAVINQDLSASRTLHADTTYTISGYIKVASGAVLTIEPGTTIVGDTAVSGSSLWILRGARIEANGTATAPIVFTSQRAVGNRKPGDWGGIIIVGNGIINRNSGGAPILTEGGAAGQEENYAGGTNNADNSGSLNFVRIEFAGFDISGAGGQELNGLSMYAVGSGTRLENVEVMAGLDDSFEWWGGAVDGHNLISYESGDDHFDWSEGYRGRNQFLIAYQSTRLTPTGTGTQSADPRGIEADGCDPSLPFCTVTDVGASEPFSAPVFANFAIVGPGTTVAGFPADGNGVVLRRGSGGTLDRGIVARWPGLGLNGRDAWTDSLRLRDSLSITNMVLAENAGGNYDVDPARFFQEAKFVASNHRTATATTDLFTSLTPGTNGQGFDWRPPSAAAPNASLGAVAAVPPLLAGRVAGYPYGTWETTSYVGPAGVGTTTWWLGWTNYEIN
jgi:hypothetical protein